MSVADIFLRCERCDLAGFVTGAPLNVAYIIDGHEVPMHVVLGYCPDCDSLGASWKALIETAARLMKSF